MVRIARWMSEHLPRVWLTLFCVAVWTPGFFNLPATDRDESRFALATEQMLQTGDFVRIMNGTEARNRKPIGIHWLQAPFVAAAQAAGLAADNPIWPYRLPSALGGLLAVLATFEIGITLFDRRTAFTAAAMLAASVLLVIEVHIAKTDAAMVGAITMSLAILAKAWRVPTSLRPRAAAMFWVALGAGILLKGPIAPMVIGLTALGLAIWERSLGWIGALRPGRGIALMLLIVAPWFIAIGIATDGAFFHDAVGGDLGRKLVSGDESHGAPPGLHLLLLPLLAFPATVPVLRALPDIWRSLARRTSDPAIRFLVAWIIPSWLMFEAVPTKLPHYTLPLYPAIMLLAARWWCDPSRRAAPRWLAIGSGVVLILIGVGIGGGLIGLSMAVHSSAVAGQACLLAAIIAIGLALMRPAGWAVLLAPAFYAATLQLALPLLSPLWIAPRIAAAARNSEGGELSPEAFGALGYHEPSLMFLAGPRMLWVGTPADAGRLLCDRPGMRIVVDKHDADAVVSAASACGAAANPLATIVGFNYSRGRRVELILLRRADTL